METRKEQDLETRSELVEEKSKEIENTSSKQRSVNNGSISGQSFDPASIEAQNCSKKSDMVFRENSNNVLLDNAAALNEASDNFPQSVSRQISNVPSTPGTLRRKMKGHVRTRSTNAGGSGSSGQFIPTHKRNQSVLSKISKLSILTLGDGQELDDISSGDEDDDAPDGIELEIGPQHICEDLDCDHTREGAQCKHQVQIKTTPNVKKTKKKKRKSPTELISTSYQSIKTLVHQFFCISTKNVLGRWRFTRSLNWYSTPEYVNRLFMIGQKSNEHFLSKIMETHITDVNTVQTKFIGNKNGIGNKYTSAKYTPLTFLPFNLLEQFRRLANAYFLLILIICYILYMFNSTSINPKSWALSVAFIFGVTMIKQGYEDFQRHRNDRHTNKRPVKLIKNGIETKTTAERICVGDIISLVEDDVVPCDAVILSTSHESHQAYVMTANLDGETSLKTKFSSKLAQHIKTAKDVSNFEGCVECENPNPKLDSYLGRMFGSRLGTERISNGASHSSKLGDYETCALSSDNILLSGTQLKNTNWVFAVCVYGGPETKIALNSRININKIGSVEKMLNRYIIYFFFAMVMQIIVFTIVTMTEGLEYCYDEDEASNWPLGTWLGSYRSIVNHGKSLEGNSEGTQPPWYLTECIAPDTGATVLAFAEWMILFSYLIPISLFVSLEILRFLSSMQFRWDILMYDEERDIPAACHTSDINEELGLVTHLFTDKTGTLTQNVMVFRKYCSNATMFEVDNLPDETYNKFVMSMLVCHSVEVTNEGKFVASSPEEKTTLEVLKDAGYVFLGAELNGTINLSLNGKRVTYKRLAELPFDSYRKCMTVVIKETIVGQLDMGDTDKAIKESSNEVIHMFIKGADGVILPACLATTTSTKAILDQTQVIVNKYASDGLRTLVYGYKKLSRDEFEQFTRKLDLAKQSMVNRDKFVREAYRDLEAEGLDLLGATAIEDKLQEEVAETITMLRKAGITTWMVTGDKKETAVNLGYASGMLQSQSNIIDLSEVKDRKSLVVLIKQLHRQYRNHTQAANTSLIIDGKGISAIMKSIHLKRRLTDIANELTTVIACRLSPVQKSQLVRMMKFSHAGVFNEDNNALNLTAAIGDGGNDVSMIQEAHVGIGIIGHEGNAANAAADFAFTKFKYLQRAFLVHGHWYYTRISFLAQYSFYKQIACFLAHDFYGFYSNFSAQTMYNSNFLLFYNTFYTLVPAVVYGLYEQPYSDTVLLKQPELYRINREKDRHLRRSFSPWIISGLWHAIVIFFGCILYAETNISQVNGDNMDMRYLGDLLGGATVTVVNLKILLEARCWNWPLVISIICSIGLYPIATILLECWYAQNRDGTLASFSPFDTFRVYQKGFSKECILSFLLFHLLIVFLSLLPDFVFIVVKFIKETFRMSRYQSEDPVIKTTLKFQKGKKQKTSSSQDCKLESFQQQEQLSNIDIINESHADHSVAYTSKSTNSNSSVKITPDHNAINGMQPRMAYDNPSFERDTSLNNISSLRRT